MKVGFVTCKVNYYGKLWQRYIILLQLLPTRQG